MAGEWVHCQRHDGTDRTPKTRPFGYSRRPNKMASGCPRSSLLRSWISSKKPFPNKYCRLFRSRLATAFRHIVNTPLRARPTSVLLSRVACSRLEFIAWLFRPRWWGRPWSSFGPVCGFFPEEAEYNSAIPGSSGRNSPARGASGRCYSSDHRRVRRIPALFHPPPQRGQQAREQGQTYAWLAMTAGWVCSVVHISGYFCYLVRIRKTPPAAGPGSRPCDRERRRAASPSCTEGQR